MLKKPSSERFDVPESRDQPRILTRGGSGLFFRECVGGTPALRHSSSGPPSPRSKNGDAGDDSLHGDDGDDVEVGGDGVDEDSDGVDEDGVDPVEQ